MSQSNRLDFTNENVISVVSEYYKLELTLPFPLLEPNFVLNISWHLGFIFNRFDIKHETAI